MAPFTHDYASAAKILVDPKIQVSQPYRDAVGSALQALASGSPQAKASAAQKLMTIPRSNLELQVNLLALLGSSNLALQRIEDGVTNGSGAVRVALWFPTMDAARRDPSFPALLERVGLMRYWKSTHTKPDVCLAKDPPPFCRLI
jgi:hypothetical protein